MLREYRLTNFKAFGETVTIPIRRLTLIFGANSSGKSSIFQSLLMLKQTLEEAKNPNTALLPKGSLVDLGTYRDFVHRHETERDFEFGARFDLEETEALLPPLAREIIERIGTTNAGLAVRFSSLKERGVYLRHVDLAIGERGQAIISYFRHVRLHPSTLKHPSERFSYSEEVGIKPELEFWRCLHTCTQRYIITRRDSFPLPFIEKLNNYQFEDAIKDIGEALPFSQVDYENFLPKSHLIPHSCLFQIFDDPTVDSILDKSGLYNYILDDSGDEDEYVFEVNMSPFVSHICSPFERALRDLVYLGPLRSRPKRFYEYSGDTTDYVGPSGEYLPSILFKRPKLVEQINKDLKELDMKYKVELDKLQYYEDASPSDIFALRLVDTETEIDASPRDVGFGIGQVLPIVAQSRLSEKKTLLIEQPEIHLHPAHQAELGDMFIRSALGEQKNTFLLETHSENLILRILRRIRETNDNELPEGFPPIGPEDVAILYVQPGENGAEVIEIPVTEDGDFASPWPQGFFEEREQDLF